MDNFQLFNRPTCIIVNPDVTKILKGERWFKYSMIHKHPAILGSIIRVTAKHSLGDMLALVLLGVEIAMRGNPKNVKHYTVSFVAKIGVICYYDKWNVPRNKSIFEFVNMIGKNKA